MDNDKKSNRSITTRPVPEEGQGAVTTIPDFPQSELVKDLLSTDRKYQNGRQPVLVDRSFKEILDAMSKLGKIEVSQIVNNSLRFFIGYEGKFCVLSEIHQHLDKQHSALSEKFGPLKAKK